MKILVTRPRQACEEIARRLADMGHQALLAPLSAVRFLDGPPLGLDGVQAILATSANGVEALARRNLERDIEIYAVGPRTAQAARAGGFIRIRSAGGDARALAGAVCRWADPNAGILLHAAGEEAGAALCEILTARGFKTRREILYRMERATHFPAEAAQALRKGEVDAALFFSPNSARLFAECAARGGLSGTGVIAICISANTAEALKDLAFAEIRIATEPNRDALLGSI